MKSKNITACLVVHNEEDTIERCLKSCKGVVDHILVVHDGKCTDNTLKISKKFTDQIHERPRVGEAEPHRAWLYQKVKTPWILQLDADEYLSEEASEVIQQLQENQGVSIYSLLWKAWDGEKYITDNWPHKKILFRKKDISYMAFPHEEVRPLRGTIQELPVLLEHKPKYNNYTLGTFRKKWLPWTKIHAQHYLIDYRNLDSFPEDKKVRPHYYNLMKLAPFSAVPLFCYHSTAMLLVGAAKQGIFGFKLSLMMGVYYTIVNLRVGYYCLFGSRSRYNTKISSPS